MKELITITVNQKGTRIVSARELHQFLESKKDFSSWIKHKLKKFQFVENQDYAVFTQLGENPTGGRPSSEYALTVHTAKELAMVEGTAKGKVARQYFIDCEERLLAIASLPTPPPAELSRKELAQMVVQAEEEKEKLQAQITEQKPMVEYVQNVLASESEITTTLIARDLGMTANMLNRRLHDLGIQFKQGHTWVLYRQYADKQLAKLRTHVFSDSAGKSRTTHYLVWTELGRYFIHERMKNAYNLPLFHQPAPQPQASA